MLEYKKNAEVVWLDEKKLGKMFIGKTKRKEEG